MRLTALFISLILALSIVGCSVPEDPAVEPCFAESGNDTPILFDEAARFLMICSFK